MYTYMQHVYVNGSAAFEAFAAGGAHGGLAPVAFYASPADGRNIGPVRALAEEGRDSSGGRRGCVELVCRLRHQQSLQAHMVDVHPAALWRRVVT